MERRITVVGLLPLATTKEMHLTPTAIFRIDGAGALITAMCIGILMPRFPELFHLPQDTLLFLALIACCFSAYSLACSVVKSTNWQPFLKGIAIANISYCLVTAALVSVYRDQLGLFDYGYFVGEIIIVVSLAGFELKSATSKST